MIGEKSTIPYDYSHRHFLLFAMVRSAFSRLDPPFSRRTTSAATSSNHRKHSVVAQMSTAAPAPQHPLKANSGVIPLPSFDRNTPSRHVYAKNADREVF